MKIVVSACLLGNNCRYDGGNNRSELLIALLGNPAPDGTLWEIVPVCPEQMGGLPTPREPAEIKEGTVQTATGKSVDNAFRLGAQRAWETVQRSGARIAVLKANSPSCGANGIYDGTFSHRIIPGKGVFAELLAEHGVTVLTEKELQRFPGVD